jgi:hypothetical protein
MDQQRQAIAEAASVRRPAARAIAIERLALPRSEFAGSLNVAGGFNLVASSIVRARHLGRASPTKGPGVNPTLDSVAPMLPYGGLQSNVLSIRARSQPAVRGGMTGSQSPFLLPEPYIWFALRARAPLSAVPKMAQTLFLETL